MELPLTRTGDAAEPRRGNGALRTPAFIRYFSAIGVSAFGTALTAVAMPVLVVTVLGADPFEVGIVNAAGFLPYAVLGLFAGVYVDRWSRQRVLVWASVGRAVSLALIPVLWVAGILHVWVLVSLLLLFGAFSVFGFAATQSLLPQIVERRALLAANARLDQVDAAAQTAGPALGGTVVGVLGAPLTIAIDAVTYIVDAVLIAGARITESARPPTAQRSLRREIGEGLRWGYRHRRLGPLAWSTHTWFFANAAAFTVLAVFALRTLGVSPVVFGLLLAFSGVAMLLGATLAVRAGARFGSGATITATRAVYPVAWLLVALVPVGAGTDAVALTLLFAALALQGFAGGLENPNEMSLRQTLTPDALLGRVNGTMRAANRTMAAAGAVAGGVAVTLIGIPPTLWCLIGIFTTAFLIALLSPVRSATTPGETPGVQGT